MADNAGASRPWPSEDPGQPGAPPSETAAGTGRTPPPHALAVLGARLAEARRARGLSPDELAGRLHIGSEQLRALESADLSQLPEPVFVIALARRLAQALDVDIEDAIVALRRQSTPTGRLGERVRPAPRQGLASRSASGGPLRRPPLPLLVGLALAGLATALGLAARQLAHRLPRLTPVSSHTAAPAPSQPPRPAARPPAPGQLLLSSPEPSWIAVRDGSGAVLFQGMLAGEKRFAIGSGLEVRAGRPDLVRASRPGMPPQPLGPIERVIWYSFPPLQASAR